MFFRRQEKLADKRDALAITAIGAQGEGKSITEQLEQFDKDL
jgi:hypothetical protein